LRATVGPDVSESFHFSHSERSEAKSIKPMAYPRVVRRDVSTWLDMTNGGSPANCNHFAIRLVIVSKIVFPRLLFDYVEKKLFELFIARA
jgi:hypothetical protein